MLQTPIPLLLSVEEIPMSEGGDNEDVKDDLRTFINKLESGSREKISGQDADMLIQFANEIMARL